MDFVDTESGDRRPQRPLRPFRPRGGLGGRGGPVHGPRPLMLATASPPSPIGRGRGEGGPGQEHRTPNTEPRTPNPEHRPPNTDHRTPNTDHSTPTLASRPSTLRLCSGQALAPLRPAHPPRFFLDNPTRWSILRAVTIEGVAVVICLEKNCVAGPDITRRLCHTSVGSGQSPRAVSVVPPKEECSTTRQRRRFSAHEKVAILRRHLLESTPAGLAGWGVAERLERGWPFGPMPAPLLSPSAYPPMPPKTPTGRRPVVCPSLSSRRGTCLLHAEPAQREMTA